MGYITMNNKEREQSKVFEQVVITHPQSGWLNGI